MTTRSVTLLISLALLLIACQLSAPPTPEPIVVATPTSVETSPMPTEALPARPTITSPLSPLATPAIVVVARQEGSPLAALTLVKLQPGHTYRLSVTSRSGAVAFSGTWSTSAVGTNGLPGVKTGLLDGKTPANYDIVPPVTKVARDWVYSASASSKGGGDIAVFAGLGPPAETLRREMLARNHAALSVKLGVRGVHGLQARC